MSSLLRISKLAQQQRILQSQRILTYSRSRQFSWAPAAYRSQQKPRAKRRHTTPRKKIGRGRDGLWQHLQEFYGDTDNTKEKEPSHEKQDPDTDRKNNLSRQKTGEEKLDRVQQEFLGILGSYQEALFSNNNSNDKKRLSLPQLLNNLHEQCVDAVENKEALVVSMDTLLNTENQFRELGKLVRLLIALQCRLVMVSDNVTTNDNKKETDSHASLAEDLLRSLIRLKSDRALLVERAKESLQQEANKKKEKGNTFTGWLMNLFATSPGVESTEDVPTQDEPNVMVHEERSFGPNKKQFHQVITCIRKESYAYNWESQGTNDIFVVRAESKIAREGLLQCANRMAALLELLPSQNMAPDLSLTAPVLETFAEVGTLEAANEVKRIYTDICNKKVPRNGFHVILRAFQLAALMEAEPEARAEAASAAIALLEDRERYALATSYYSFPGTHDPRGEAYAIVMETLENAGGMALPERISQGETLAKRYFGENFFHQVVDRQMRSSQLPKVDMRVFKSLLSMYALRIGEHKYVSRAKNILKCAEEQIAATTSTEKISDTDVEKPLFPNTKTYNDVLNGIRKNINRILARVGQAKNESKTEMARQIILDEAVDATSFLDRMTQTCTPDLRTFELLLNIWATVKLPESGQRADEIMSRMNIRQACSGPSDAWLDSSRVYSLYLECWSVHPEVSTTRALHRALRVLDKMEAQSGIQYRPLSTLDTAARTQVEEDILGLVYEQNNMDSYRAAYNATLKICSLCLEAPEEAFEAAFGVYNRMIAAGVEPDEQTFTNLFACCFLAGEDDAAAARRLELAKTVIAFASDHGVNTRIMTKQLKTFYQRQGKLGKPKR